MWVGVIVGVIVGVGVLVGVGVNVGVGLGGIGEGVGVAAMPPQAGSMMMDRTTKVSVIEFLIWLPWIC